MWRGVRSCPPAKLCGCVCKAPRTYTPVLGALVSPLVTLRNALTSLMQRHAGAMPVPPPQHGGEHGKVSRVSLARAMLRCQLADDAHRKYSREGWKYGGTWKAWRVRLEGIGNKVQSIEAAGEERGVLRSTLGISYFQTSLRRRFRHTAMSLKKI